jgi:hypothetical protein
LKKTALFCLLAAAASAPLFADDASSAPDSPTASAPTAAPSPEPSADPLIVLQRRADDQAAAIAKLQSALEDLKTDGRTNGGPSEEADSAWNRLKFHINTEIRFDNTYDKNPQNNSPLGGGGLESGGPLYIPSATPDGSSGFYFKHVDLKFTYRIDDSTVAYLHYNLSALELDKVGVEFRDLPIPPFTSGWPDWTYSLFVGQRRQYFGIEQQTEAEDLYFPNRAMMDGGTNPFGNTFTKTNNPFNFYDAPSLAINNLVPQLVYDKVMGIHFFQKHDFGFLAYSLGVDLVNDESEESFDGGGTDSLKTGFAFQLLDQDLSEIGRLGLEPRIVNDLLPWNSKLEFGFSAFHDPENTAYLTSQSLHENWADTIGWDGKLSTGRDVVSAQAEWVRREQFSPSFVGSGNNWTPVNTYGGLAGAAEGWYATVALQPWRLFDPKAPRVELLGRYDTIAYMDQSQWLQSATTGAGGYRGSYNATTIGLRFIYKGNCHTGFYYTTYGLNNNFNAVGPTQLIQLDEQVYY